MTGLELDYRERAGRTIDRLMAAGPIDIRKLIGDFGSSGLIAERWKHGDHSLGIALIEEVAIRGAFGAAVGASLHVEAVTSILQRFGASGLADWRVGALDGTQMGCVAVSEPHVGSDMAAVTTSIALKADKWHVTGEKKFVTNSTIADMALVLGRIEGAASPRTALVLVPRSGYEVLRTHSMEGADELDTSWIRVNAVVPRSNLLGPPGAGVAVLTWGLIFERLAVSAQVLATCRLALDLAVTRAHMRQQFGVQLWDHQALRLRLAELESKRASYHAHLMALAGMTRPDGRQVAGLKLVVSRFGEQCVSECMHIFGADGYVQGATPLGRLWRAIRMARIGGGTDEMMAEIVASGLRAHPTLYRKHIPTPVSGQA